MDSSNTFYKIAHMFSMLCEYTETAHKYKNSAYQTLKMHVFRVQQIISSPGMWSNGIIIGTIFIKK